MVRTQNTHHCLKKLAHPYIKSSQTEHLLVIHKYLILKLSTFINIKHDSIFGPMQQ